MARLKIQAFGGLRVFDTSGLPLPLPAKKVQALLAYLALHAGRPQGRPKLAALLWGESNETLARASLRQALLVLRKSLQLGEDTLILGVGETIEFSAQGVDLDVDHFERLLAEGTSESLEQAARLYTGELLEGLDTREPGFDDWLAARRDHLRERMLAALSRLLADQTARGRIDRAIEVGLRLLALDPLQESVHRDLMQLYARQGRHDAALRQFELCRDVLTRELGAAPQPKTLQTLEAIRHERMGESPVVQASEAIARVTMELRPVAILVLHTPAFDDTTDIRPSDACEPLGIETAQVIARFGGTLQGGMGASLTALFGVPVAHGNDLERAARCAVALRDRSRAARIGLTAGTVLVTPRNSADAASFAVSGEAVAMAARLSARAEEGELLVSETAWRSLSRIADGVARPAASLSASLQSTRCWTLVALRPGQAAHSDFVGRRTEIAQFSASLQACERDRAGLTIHLRGEAGIGKSRLVDEFRSIAVSRGFVCHGGVVLDFGGGAERDALRTLVLGLLGVDAGSENVETVAAAVARALAAGLIDPVHEMPLLVLLHQPLPASLRAVFDAMDHATRERAQDNALAQLLSRCSDHAPHLLVLEDLHWAAPRLLSRIATLAAVVESTRAVLVTTARSDGDPLDLAWRGTAGVSALVTFDLGPLRWTEASALAARYAGLTDAFVIRCVERSGGNPLFLEQLLLGGGETEAALPGSVQSIVHARLDTLPVGERHAVRTASVLGQRFPLAALKHLLAGAAWDPYETRGLLRVEGREGLFAHALVHEGAYASLTPEQRRALHVDAANWFGGRDAALRAEHLDRAGDPRAAEAYLEAALAQGREHRPERALQLAERGFQVAGGDKPRFALACCRADTLYDLGAMAAAREAYDVALELAQEAAERCRALLGLATVLRVLDKLEGAEAALYQTEAIAKEHGLIEQQARVHFLRGNLLFPRGDLAGCQREHQHSLRLARQAGSVELEAAALGGLADAAFLHGHMLTAHDRFSDCVRLARQHGLRRIEAANLPMMAITQWYAGDTPGALASAEAAVATAAQIGHQRAEAIAHHGAYQCNHALMRFDAALAHIERALVLARQINARRFEAEALGFRGEVLCAMGQRRAALADLYEAIAISRETGMSFMGPIFLGMTAGATDDPAERSSVLAEAEALLGTNNLLHNHLLFRRDAIDISLATGEWEAALHHADALEAQTRSQPLPWSDFFVARGRALAQRGLCPGDADRDVLRQLRDLATKAGLLIAVAAIDAALAS